MENQKPPSKVTLMASLAFFGFGGLLLAGLGISGIGDEPGAIWVVVFGVLLTIGTIMLAPVVLRGAETQRRAFEKQEKMNRSEDNELHVHAQMSSGHNDVLSSMGSIVVILIVLVVGIFAIRGGWNYMQDKFGSKNYKAFFYYDPNDLNRYWAADVSSIDGCHDWVNSQVNRDFDGNYDYECGVNCEYKAATAVYVCKETLE